MSYTVHPRAQDISKIISDYRRGELCFELDADHVVRWVQQFNPATQETILEETFHVLSNWYFDDLKITEFLKSIVDYLEQKDVSFDNITFWNGQASGKSQSRLLRKLKGLFPMCNIHVDKEFRTHIIYVDDGLYTGSKIRKEISDMVRNAPSFVSSIDAFVLVAYSNGLSYTRDVVRNIGNEHGINIRINRYKEVANEKRTEYSAGGETYTSTLGVLWPSRALGREPLVTEYEKNLTAKGSFPLKYKTHSQYTSQIFTSIKQQEVIEQAFLLAGLKILPQSSIAKGLYPLGYDTTPSFGFGSFCATEFNISNTCPIVLWWDVGNSWYPLLPRRTTEEELRNFE